MGNAEASGGTPASGKPGKSITVISPNEDTVYSGQPLSVCWEADGVDGDFLVQVFDDQQRVHGQKSLPGENKLFLTLCASLMPPGKSYCVTVCGGDCQEEVSGSSPWFFVKEPSITLTSPVDGDALCPGQLLTVSWVAEGVLGDRIVQVFSRAGAGEVHAQTCPWSQSRVDLDLSGLPLSAGEAYCVTVTDSLCRNVSTSSAWLPCPAAPVTTEESLPSSAEAQLVMTAGEGQTEHSVLQDRPSQAPDAAPVTTEESLPSSAEAQLVMAAGEGQTEHSVLQDRPSQAPDAGAVTAEESPHLSAEAQLVMIAGEGQTEHSVLQDRPSQVPDRDVSTEESLSLNSDTELVTKAEGHAEPSALQDRSFQAPDKNLSWGGRDIGPVTNDSLEGACVEEVFACLPDDDAHLLIKVEEIDDEDSILQELSFQASKWMSSDEGGSQSSSAPNSPIPNGFLRMLLTDTNGFSNEPQFPSITENPIGKEEKPDFDPSEVDLAEVAKFMLEAAVRKNKAKEIHKKQNIIPPKNLKVQQENFNEQDPAELARKILEDSVMKNKEKQISEEKTKSDPKPMSQPQAFQPGLFPPYGVIPPLYPFGMPVGIGWSFPVLPAGMFVAPSIPFLPQEEPTHNTQTPVPEEPLKTDFNDVKVKNTSPRSKDAGGRKKQDLALKRSSEEGKQKRKKAEPRKNKDKGQQKLEEICCKVCDILFPTKHNYLAHINGKKHNQRVQALKDEAQINMLAAASKGLGIRRSVSFSLVEEGKKVYQKAALVLIRQHVGSTACPPVLAHFETLTASFTTPPGSPPKGRSARSSPKSPTGSPSKQSSAQKLTKPPSGTPLKKTTATAKAAKSPTTSPARQGTAKPSSKKSKKIQFSEQAAQVQKQSDKVLQQLSRGLPPFSDLCEKPYAKRPLLEQIERNVRSILNKLTREKFDQLLEQISCIKIESSEILDLVIGLVFNKALDEPHFCDMYADLCYSLNSSFKLASCFKAIYDDDSRRWFWTADAIDEDYVYGPFASLQECFQDVSCIKELGKTRCPYGYEIDSLRIKDQCFIKLIKAPSQGYYASFTPAEEAKQRYHVSSEGFLSEKQALKNAIRRRGFKSFLLNKCQEQFEKQDIYEELTDLERNFNWNSLSSEAERLAKKQEFQEKRWLIKRRMLGNVRFIGELYKKDMVKERLIYECLHRLLRMDAEQSRLSPDEEDVESVVALLVTVGKKLDAASSDSKEVVSTCMDLLERMCEEGKLSSRIRFMIRDLLDLRTNDWNPRRKEAKAMTIKEIRKEVECEFENGGCDECKPPCASHGGPSQPEPLRGKRHPKQTKEGEKGHTSTLPKNSVQDRGWCAVCKKQFADDGALQVHLQGELHRHQVKISTKAPSASPPNARQINSPGRRLNQDA